MLAFHNDKAVKTKYLDRVNAHIAADNLVKGQYWENGKGCAVGCTIEGNDHSAYERELGIPEWMARLEDTLFEGMTDNKSETWPKVFLDAIEPGMELERVKSPLMLVVLKSALKTQNENKNFDVDEYPDVAKCFKESKKILRRCIKLYSRDDVCSDEWSAARSAARSAAESAARSVARSAESAARSVESAARSVESAARSAAWSAESAAWSARSAVESAAWSARSAARSAESAVESAAWSAESAAESAAWSARSAKYDYFSDQLIKIIKDLKANNIRKEVM